jgi:Fe-S-cluster containining protein
MAFDHLYRDIGSVCADCKDHDCEGYVWLIAEEAEMLYNRNIPIVEINEGIYFIHSFQKIDGRIAVDIPKPPCSLRKNKLCTIYQMRPLVCRMYPVGLTNHNSKLLLVMHHDCQFSRELSGENKISFFKAVANVFQSIPREVIEDIIATYLKIDELSSFPDGQNSYEIIATIDEILRRGGSYCV